MDELKWKAGMKLHLSVPTSGFIRLFRNGAMVQEGKNDTADFAVAES